MTFQWRHVRLGINPASIDSARKIPVVFVLLKSMIALVTWAEQKRFSYLLKISDKLLYFQDFEN